MQRSSGWGSARSPSRAGRRRRSGPPSRPDAQPAAKRDERVDQQWVVVVVGPLDQQRCRRRGHHRLLKRRRLVLHGGSALDSAGSTAGNDLGARLSLELTGRRVRCVHLERCLVFQRRFMDGSEGRVQLDCLRRPLDAVTQDCRRLRRPLATTRLLHRPCERVPVLRLGRRGAPWEHLLKTRHRAGETRRNTAVDRRAGGRSCGAGGAGGCDRLGPRARSSARRLGHFHGCGQLRLV
eukprot:scaffold7204_cov102-Isochrysis_galbana.AAC.6